MQTVTKAKRPPWMPKREAHGRRVNANSAFYNSPAWRKNRLAYLMQNPYCVLCMEDDRIEPATVVDHIVRVNDGGDRMAWHNLQSLCSTCHNSKSGREAHQAKAGGGLHP